MASTFILATGGYDTSVRFFDATQQTLIRTLPFPDQHVIRLAFSGEGPAAVDEPLYIAVAGSPTICVYDVSTNDTSPNLFVPYTKHTEAVTAVGFEPKHTSFVYSASEDGTLQTWLPSMSTAPQAQAAAVPTGHTDGNGHTDMFVPNGGIGFIQPNGNPFTPTKFVNDGPNGIVAIHDATYYPPEGLFFTVDAIGRLRIWDQEDVVSPQQVIPHPSKRNIQCLELSSDYQTLVMANFDGYVFVYNTQKLLANQEAVRPITFRASDSYITRVRMSVSANLLVCTTKQGTTLVFRMADVIASNSAQNSNANGGDTKILPLRELPAQHQGWMWDAAFVGDGEDYLFTCGTNTQVMLWALNDMRNSTEYPGNRRAVVCLAVKERLNPGVPNEEFGLDHTTANSLRASARIPEFRAASDYEEDEDDDDAPGGPGPSHQAANGEALDGST